MKPKYFRWLFTCLLLTSTTHAQSESSSEANNMAKTLANPIDALISVPFQNNYDYDGGPTGEGRQFKLNLQPVAFTLGARYYVDKPEGGPDWGLRFAVVFLFPKSG